MNCKKIFLSIYCILLFALCGCANDIPLNYVDEIRAIPFNSSDNAMQISYSYMPCNLNTIRQRTNLVISGNIQSYNIYNIEVNTQQGWENLGVMCVGNIKVDSVIYKNDNIICNKDDIIEVILPCTEIDENGNPSFEYNVNPDDINKEFIYMLTTQENYTQNGEVVGLRYTDYAQYTLSNGIDFIWSPQDEGYAISSIWMEGITEISVMGNNIETYNSLDQETNFYITNINKDSAIAFLGHFFNNEGEG